MRILLVEDDETLVAVLTPLLESQNYVVDVAADGQQGWAMAESAPYDLILLDVMLPQLDGIAFCQRLRNQQNPVLVMLLTARDTATDKLVGLDAGADDYLVKPFNLQELNARIRALLRRGSTTTLPILIWGDLQLNPSMREITYQGQPLQFSRKEYLLLELLLRNPQRVFSRSAIIDQVWSFDEDPPSEDTVKSHIKSIRRKLKPFGASDCIETLYGQGYRLNGLYQQGTGVLSEIESSSPSPAAIPDLSMAVTQIWQRTKATTLERVASLQDMTQSLYSAVPQPDLRQKAIAAAHKLTGSLGTFGFEAGSRLAQQIERLFLSDQAQMAAAQRALVLLDSLTQELEQTATPTAMAPDHLASTDLEEPLLLVIDADASFTEPLAAAVPTWRMRLAIATDFAQARHQIAQHHPDVVLVDPMLEPDRDLRLSNLQNLLTHQPSLPIVICSAQDILAEQGAIAPLKCHLFLSKPTLLPQVRQAIEQVRQQHRVTVTLLMISADLPSLTPWKEELIQQGIEVIGLTEIGLVDQTQLGETLSRIQPDGLVLDLDESLAGLVVCQRLRSDFRWSQLPIFCITPTATLRVQQRVLQQGADDCFAKTQGRQVSLARLIKTLRRLQPSTDFFKTSRLTGLLPRRQTEQALKRLFGVAQRSQQPVSLAVLNLDQFRAINDQYGYVQGDRVLRQFSHFLKQRFRAEDVVGHWGGDEFVIGLYGMERRHGVERLALLLEAWRHYPLQNPTGEALTVRFSAGIAQYPLDGLSVPMLYRTADAAVYQAKQASGDRVLPAGWQPLTATAPPLDVLLVYPQTESGQQLFQALQTRGYHSSWVHSSQAAFNRLQSLDASRFPRVLLLFDRLDLDGLTFLKRLQPKRFKGFHILLLLENAERAELVLAHGASDYIRVPCDLYVILQRLCHYFGDAADV